MTESRIRPVLYMGKEDRSQRALELLKQAGFDVDVRCIPVYHPVAVTSGTPVLFGLSNKFEGIEGVRIFIENATFLGYDKLWRNHR